MANGEVAPPGKIGAGDPQPGRFKLTNKLTRLEVPSLGAPVTIESRDQVSNSHGPHSGDIFVTARVELAEQIAFEIPNPDLATSPAQQQLTAVGRKVAASLKAAQSRQR